MLFDDSSMEKEDSLVLLSTLTRTQVAAVERRLTSLTLRKRKHTHHVPDVRDIFRQGSKVRYHQCHYGGHCRFCLFIYSFIQNLYNEMDNLLLPPP